MALADRARPRPPRRSRAGLASLLAGVAAAATLASGCGAIPSVGSVQSTPTPPAPGVGGSSCCALIVRGPQHGWSPQEIVNNFLLASASFAGDHAIARQYLTPEANRHWHPQSPVTIIAGTPKVKTLREPPFGTQDIATVTVTGQQVATLDPSGEYVPAAHGGAVQEQNFYLERDHAGQWRISSLPSTGPANVSRELLLTNFLFHQVYQPRNLYFFAGPDQKTLVPDPVFVPEGSQNLVESLVEDLLHNPGGWLAGAAFTDFPAGTQVRGVQAIPGPARTAIVDLRVPFGRGVSTSKRLAEQRQMAEQLVWTLTSAAYSPALFQAVKLKINGHLWPANQSVQGLDSYRKYIPGWGKGLAVYGVAANGAVRVLSKPSAVPGDVGSGRLPLNSIAVSADGRHLAGVAPGALYTADLTGSSAGMPHARVLAGSGFSTPVWDHAGDLWVAGRVEGMRDVWVWDPHSGRLANLALPVGTGRITGLRMAPDGIRLAMIAGRGAKAHLVMGAIVRSGGAFVISRTTPLGPTLTGVTALAWYDENHVLAAAGGSGTGGKLCEVPVNGEGPACRRATGEDVAITAIAAAGPLNPLYLGLSNGRLEKSVGLSEPWTDAGPGRDPTYAGE